MTIVVMFTTPALERSKITNISGLAKATPANRY